MAGLLLLVRLLARDKAAVSSVGSRSRDDDVSNVHVGRTSSRVTAPNVDLRVTEHLEAKVVRSRSTRSRRADTFHASDVRIPFPQKNCAPSRIFSRKNARPVHELAHTHDASSERIGQRKLVEEGSLTITHAFALLVRVILFPEQVTQAVHDVEEQFECGLVSLRLRDTTCRVP